MGEGTDGRRVSPIFPPPRAPIGAAAAVTTSGGNPAAASRAARGEGGPRPRPKLKRQFGCERRTGALPIIDRYPGGRELAWARVLLLITLAGFVVYLVQWIRGYGGRTGPAAIAEAWVYLLLLATLTASACGYLIARLGYIYRIRAHRRMPRKLIDDAFDRDNPTLTVIVPSYREEPRVVRQTLLSAALQEYPGIRVALLIDDPPDPAYAASGEAHLSPHVRCRRRSTRSCAGPRTLFEGALNAFESKAGSALTVPPRGAPAPSPRRTRRRSRGSGRRPTARRSSTTRTRSSWTRSSDGWPTTSPPTPEALRQAARDGAELSVTRVRQLYRRLAWIFRRGGHLVRAQDLRLPLARSRTRRRTSTATSASWAARYRVRDTAAGKILPAASPAAARPRHPRPRLRAHARRRQHAAAGVLPAARRLHVAARERPDRGRADAVLGVRGASTRLERIAGGTTDVQHIVHQGMTRFGATSWVGASAVLRKTRAGRHRRRGAARRLHRSAATSRTARSPRTASRPSICACAAGSCTTTQSGSATAPRRRTSARCASSASGGRTAASSSCRRSSA